MASFSLPEFCLAMRQRADLGGQQNAFGANAGGEITDAEATSMVQGSLAKVWGLLIRKYPENYSWGDGGSGAGQGYVIPVQQGTYRYLLPFDFYKEKGVDLALDSTLQNWASVRPYTLRDRNLFSFPLQTTLAYAGWQNMRFQIQGDYLNFLPNIGPLPGNMRLLYATKCPTLVLNPPGAYPGSSQAVALGALISVAVAGVNHVFAAVIAGTTSSGGAPSWASYIPPTASTVQDGTVIWAYKGPANLFVTTFNGISGYEEAVILDAALKARVKRNEDTSDLARQLALELQRIDEEAANRQSGDPMVISGGFGAVEGGNGFGPFGGWR